MNELLEKAKRDYPIGTKFKSMYDGSEHVSTGQFITRFLGISIMDEFGREWCLYDKSDNQWAEIINTNTMTQQEFNSLRVGEFISQYEILHKYKEFLIVRCDDGHDLFDLNKINKLGLKVTPKTFMGLEIKKYDNVPCEVDGRSLVYLTEVKDDCFLYSNNKTNIVCRPNPNSIRIL